MDAAIATLVITSNDGLIIQHFNVPLAASVYRFCNSLGLVFCWLVCRQTVLFSSIGWGRESFHKYCLSFASALLEQLISDCNTQVLVCNYLVYLFLSLSFFLRTGQRSTFASVYYSTLLLFTRVLFHIELLISLHACTNVYVYVYVYMYIYPYVLVDRLFRYVFFLFCFVYFCPNLLFHIFWTTYVTTLEQMWSKAMFWPFMAQLDRYRRLLLFFSFSFVSYWWALILDGLQLATSHLGILILLLNCWWASVK